jgi:hypothetical protein
LSISPLTPSGNALPDATGMPDSALDTSLATVPTPIRATGTPAVSSNKASVASITPVGNEAPRGLNMSQTGLALADGVDKFSEKLRFAAANGNIDRLDELLSLESFAPATLSDALFEAVKGRKVEAVTKLLSRGADVHAFHDGRTMLGRMMDEASDITSLGVVAALLEHIDSSLKHIVPRSPELWSQPRLSSCSDEDLAVVSRLLYNVEREHVSGDGLETHALHHGLRYCGHSMTPGVIHGLLDAGADLNRKLGKDRISALGIAVQLNSASIVRLMIKAGADIHNSDALGNTALHLAAYSLNVDAVRMLVTLGAIHDEPNREGNTAQSIYLDARKRNGQQRSGFQQVADHVLFGIESMGREDPLHVSWEPADCDSYRKLRMPGRV